MMVGDDDFAPASHLLDMCQKKEKWTLPQSCVEKKRMTTPFHMGIWEE